MKKDGLVIRIFNDNLGQALRVFNQRVRQSGLIKEIKRKNQFVPANEKRRIKAWRAQARKNKHKARV